MEDAIGHAEAMLGLDGFLAATLLDLFFVHADLRHQVGHRTLIAVETRSRRVYFGRDVGGGAGAIVFTHDGW